MSTLAATRLVLVNAVVAVACRSEAPPPPDPLIPVTEAETDAFGHAMAKALMPCDPVAVGALIDAVNLARRAAHGRKIPNAAKEGLLNGVAGNSLAKNLCQTLAGHATSATYLRSREVGGSRRPLIRIILGDGLNYLEFETGRVKGRAEVRAIDITSFASGESTAETIGRTLEEMVANGSAAGALADIDALKEASVKLAEHDVVAARASFDKLSASTRATKAAMVVDVQIASDESDEAYIAAMDRFSRAFPDDPALWLQSIDRYFLANDFEATLAALEKLGRFVGGDPYLDAMRVQTLGKLGRIAEAVSAGKRCVQVEPTLQECWFALVDGQLLAKDYGALAGAMREMETRFDLDLSPESLAAAPEWAGFLASPEGKAWVGWRAETRVGDEGR